MKRICLFAVTLMVTLCASAQKIKQYKYWFDDAVNKSVLTTVTPTALFTLTTAIKTDSLGTGLHRLNIQFGDDSARYSTTLSQFFYKASTVAYDTAVKSYEYWFDDDYAHKVSSTVTASTVFTLGISADASALAAGIHRFNIRFKTASLWSSTFSQYFYRRSSANSDTTVKSYEYWYDDDIAKKTTGTLTAGALVNFSANLDASSLVAGIHRLNIRFKGDSLWSSTVSQYFYRRSSANSDTAVKRYEYWYDDDVAKKTTGTLTAGATVNFSTNLDASSLVAGIHRFNIRFKGDSLWSSTVSQYFYRRSPANSDTAVKRYEYWYDDDLAKKTTGTLTAGAIVNFSTNVDASALITGLHRFNIRFKGDSLWSSTVSRTFFKPFANNDTLVKAYEYWLDDDVAHKTTGTVTAAKQLAFTASLDLQGINPGPHRFSIHFRSDSTWSTTITRYIYKTATSYITGYEYWYDDDYAHKSFSYVTPATVVNFSAAVDASATTDGLHRFNIRFRSDSSTWSSTVSRYFARSGGNITAYEYWFDNNYATKTTQAVAAAASVTVTQAVNVDALATGYHVFTIRAKGAINSWSAPVSSYFVKLGGPSGQAITGYRYWFDNNMAATRVDLAVPTPAALVNITSKINTLKLDTGQHTLYVQAKDTSGLWSATVGYQVRVVPPLVIDSAKVSVTKACPSSGVTVSAQTYGTFAAGNVFTAQLSDTAGKFTSPVTIGTLKASPAGRKQSISITAVLPASMLNSNNYRVRIISSSPALISDSTPYSIAVQKPNLGKDTVVKICPGTYANLTKLYDTTSLKPVWKLSRPDSVTASGADTLIVTNANGCKDTVVVTAIAYPKPVTQPVLVTGCNSVLYNGVTYTASTVKADTLKNTQGCDSVYRIATITVTKITPVTQNITVNGCNSAVYNGVTYTASTIKRDTVRSVQGCDSIYKVAAITVTKITPVTQAITVNGCNSVVYNGVTYTVSTIKRDTVRSIQGCDSVYKVATITVAKITPITQNVTVNGCNSVVYNGVTYTTSTVRRDTIRSAQGCDSVYKVAAITVAKITPVTQAVTVNGCGSAVYNGVTYTASAVKTDTVRSLQGCDSIYKVATITVKKDTPVVVTASLSGCNGVVYKGKTYTVSTVVKDTLRSTFGCDSVYNITTITVVTGIITTNPVTLSGCNSVLYKGITYTASTTVRDTTVQGCNVVINVATITITPIKAITKTIAMGGCNSVVYKGKTYTANAVVSDTLKSIQGCDSVYNVATITVTKITPVTQAITVNGCNSAVYNGVTYTTSVVKRDTVRSIQGCDSIYNVATITVTKITPVTQAITVNGCNSAVYNGVTYTTSAVKRDTVRSTQGCDSIYKVATITVTKITPVTQAITVNGCNSAVYNGVTYTTSAVKRDTVRSTQGCDSVYKIATITVTKITPVTQAITVNGCGSALYSGVTYTTSTVKRDTVRSTQGCDSVYKVATITIKKDTPVVVTVGISGCNGVVYKGKTYTVSTVVRDTLRSAFGCDSVYNITTITVNKITPVTQSVSVSGCGSVVYKGVTYTASAVKTDTLRSIQGCDSIYTVATITVTGNIAAPVISKIGITTICYNDSLVLTTTSTGTLQWLRNNSAIKKATLSRYVVNISGAYKLRVTNGACSAVSDSVVVNVTSVPKPIITLVNDTLISSSATGNQWYLNGRALAGVTTQSFSPDYLGNYTVQATVSNCASVMSDAFSYTANTFIKKGAGNMVVKLYPNPAMADANLKLTGVTGAVIVTVTDMTGKVVWQSEKVYLDKTITLPVAQFASGLYVVTVKDRKHIISLKLVKAK